MGCAAAMLSAWRFSRLHTVNSLTFEIRITRTTNTAVPVMPASNVKTRGRNTTSTKVNTPRQFLADAWPTSMRSDPEPPTVYTRAPRIA